jgi:DNA-binding transcriptional MerR regulator
MTEAPHLSIGEVLAQLRDEFPDITISKIRFLESQGLIDPERTPSGYRKFYDDDLIRLRWILFQQKEHFLPLKVIKERLDELPPGDLTLLDPGLAPVGAPTELAEAEPAPEAELVVVETVETEAARAPSPPRATHSTRPVPPPRRPAFAPTLPSDAGDAEAVLAPAGDGSAYTRAELARAAGIAPDDLAELEEYGLISPVREVDGEVLFDADAVDVAAACAGFFQRGVEARHLRMYRTFAEREAVLFGQVLMPYVRQRNPEARARLQGELIELATLGRRLRTALLRDAVRESLAE